MLSISDSKVHLKEVKVLRKAICAFNSFLTYLWLSWALNRDILSKLSPFCSLYIEVLSLLYFGVNIFWEHPNPFSPFVFETFL